MNKKRGISPRILILAFAICLRAPKPGHSDVYSDQAQMNAQMEANNQNANATQAIATAQAAEAKAIAAANPPGNSPPLVSNAFPCDDPVNRLIASTYVDVLGRNVSKPEADSWRSTVNLPQDIAQFAAGVNASPEAAKNDVNIVFQQLLGRAAEPAGAAYWSSYDRRGMTIQIACCAKEFGTPNGTDADSAWVNKVYQKLLGRSAEDGGTSYWLNILYYGTNNPKSGQVKQLYASNVAQGIYDSSESHQHLVKEAYNTLLRRDAEPAGLQYWANLMDKGLSWENLRAGIMSDSGNQEYYKYAQKRTDICPPSN